MALNLNLICDLKYKGKQLYRQPKLFQEKIVRITDLKREKIVL